jgi:hypothetical protein
MYYLNNRNNDSWIFLDAALVDSALHQNVTPRSPGGSPRITDDPVGELESNERDLSGSPSDDDHVVIDCLVIAGGVIVDANPV